MGTQNFVQNSSHSKFRMNKYADPSKRYSNSQLPDVPFHQKPMNIHEKTRMNVLSKIDINADDINDVK